MMKPISLRFFSFFLGISISSIISGSIYKGVVLDVEDKSALIGANVYVPGTSVGTITNLDGSFKLDIPSGTKQISVTYVGYQSKEVNIESANEGDLGAIELKSDAVALSEVYVTASFAIDRVTPIAVSTIKTQQIVEKLGTQEIAEMLKSAPGVYVTKRGGGFGDADLRIRGFTSENVAVLINGMPVNGMEDDKVYWSNWAGLSDVSQTMQLQRGIGASRIAVPSVGGTVNVITKTTDNDAGGTVYYTHGNDLYHKYGVNVSTGLNEKNLAATISLSRTTGQGYVEGTPFTSYSYFMNISKKLNDQHQLAFSLFGAPQNHAKRFAMMQIDVLESMKDGHRYNADWGYRKGQFFSNSTNFYHKPVAMLNHYWNLDELTFISTSIYASAGIGGGGYASFSETPLTYGIDKQIDWDAIDEKNAERARQGLSTGSYFQNSYNYHSWYGALSTIKRKYGPINLLAGLDLRYYYGKHWQQADDLLGGSYYLDKRNSDAVYLFNNHVKEGGKINYDNDGEVTWSGLFLQGEFVQDKISAFASGSISNRSYRRYDFAQYFTDDLKAKLKNDVALQTEWENKLQDYMIRHKYKSILESKAYTTSQVTDWISFIGYSLKTGINYNFTDQHNLFVNGGYMERQPIFTTVFENYQNQINEDAKNESVVSLETGYGFRSKYISGNINAYYILWNNRTTRGSLVDPDRPGELFLYDIEGVNAKHTGFEMDFILKPISDLEITGMASLGNWIWNNNPGKTVVTKDQVVIDTVPGLFIKGVHVDDAAQTTAALGLNYEVFSGLKVGADINFFDRVYAKYNLGSKTNPDNEGVDSEKLPAYWLTDLNIYYKFKVGKYYASLSGNCHNVFNTIYISDASEGLGYYFGYGRTWSTSLKFNF